MKKTLKSGSLVRISTSSKHDGHQVVSPRILTSQPGQSGKGHDVGSFPVGSLGQVVETRTYAQVLVGTSLGWILIEELESVD
jgi:hypothetical protein